MRQGADCLGGINARILDRSMRYQILTIASLIGVSLVMGPAANSQGYGRCDVRPREPSPTELVVARWRYGTNGNIGHCGWWHNYPYSDEHFNEFLDNSTGVDVDLGSYLVVELGSPEVFDYPFAYVSEPGEMELTDRELRNLREFIDRGGFVLMDDFDGVWQLENMRTELLRAFPDRPLIALTPAHQVFEAHFALADLNRMAPYVPGGEITYYAMHDARGELAVAAGHNNDLANFWDWYEQARYPLEPAADAFRLGINFVIWSMTH